MTSANVSMAMNAFNNVSNSKPMDKGKGEGEMSFMSTFSKSMELTSMNQSEASPRMGVIARTVVRVSDNSQSIDSKAMEQSEKVSSVSSVETKTGNEIEEAANPVEAKAAAEDEREVTNIESNDEIKSDELTDEEVTDMAEAVSQIIANIVEILQESLDVSAEDITDAMDSMGMDITDLTSFSEIKKLFITLSGEASMDDQNMGTMDTELLFSEGFSKFSEQITEQLIAFDRENGMSAAYAVDLLGRIEEFDFEEFSSEVSNLVSAEIPDALTEAEEFEILDVKPQDQKVISPDSKPAIEFLDEDTEAFTVKTEEQIQPENSTSENKGESFDKNSKKDSGITLLGNDHSINENVAFAEKTAFSDVITEVTTPSGEVVEVPHIIDQIVQKAAIMSSNGETTMEMILNPEGLGKIYMQVSQKGDEVTARLMTENSAVKEALEASLAEVKEKLELSGTKVNDIEVSVGTHGFERNLEQGQERQQQEGAYQEELRSTTRRSLHVDTLDNLMGLMSEEEELAARIMRDNGGTLDYQA